MMKLTEIVDSLIHAGGESAESGKDGEVSAIRLCIAALASSPDFPPAFRRLQYGTTGS